MALHSSILQWVNPAGVADSLWLIIALPLLGAAINGLLGRLLGRANVNLVATAAVAGSFLLSVVTFWVINNPSITAPNPFGDATPYALGHDYGTWFSAGGFRVNFGLTVDHLSGTLLLVITGVGTLIHLYSTSYMEHDEGYWRFFAYLNLFVAMMLTLVMADNLVLLFVGWEGVGMCSYLLIGFWYKNPAYAFAGRKAFITNRVGDFGFLLGSFLLVLMMAALPAQAPAQAGALESGVSRAGPLHLKGVAALATSIPYSAAKAQSPSQVTLETQVAEGPLAGFTYGGVLTAALLLFLLGAAGKSAQVPLYVWLPDAMAGPTPVSALIHAATMVTAGVYLFCRLSPLLVLSPAAMATVAVVGGTTALLAALIAFTQDDIKKVLAYSTVSQLGLMFLGVGVGAFWAAAFHLVTHAFFKACLFLGAGSVMHGNGDETDIRRLGGLRKEMKVTWATFAVATLAITGVVPLSGFFSKDAILHAAHTHSIPGFDGAVHVAYALGLLTALSTAFYMTRAYVLAFEGERSKDARIPHAHESAAAMTGPLVVLAVLSVVGAAWAFPLLPGSHEPVFENFLLPVFSVTEQVRAAAGTVVVPEHAGLPWGAYAQAWVIALIGAGSAFFLYTKFFPSRAGQPAPAWAQFARNLSRNKFYVDEAYDAVLIRPIRYLARGAYQVLDMLLIDTVAVRGTAWVTSQVGSVLRLIQTGDVQAYAAVMAAATLGGIVYVLTLVLK
ncbi:MAG: NADH-quinone oxidoreductase subunit [Pseudomonadota bacterium]|jgi:NADH-quinone oxidoreductase subunit L